MSAKARGWRECGCYAWRTRKPTAPIGLPFIGRHFAYVGETESRYHRDPQHIRGGGKYGTIAKPWSDLDPKVYPLPCLFPRWAWARKKQETLWTLLLAPVYPVQKNRWNPRRITPRQAKQHRAERDAIGRTASALSRFAIRFGLWLVITAVVAYAYTHWGR